MEIVYWHWIVLGVALMLFEIVMTTFFIIWFGVAALIMGLVLLLNGDITLGWQVFIWTLLSVILAVAWFRYLKPLSIDRTKAGLSREAIVGETGQVIRAPREGQRGRLRFSVPILGADEWQIISEETVSVGDRVSVVDVVGNSLLVKKA
jgi:membrane protein implicated in regulation of membrane protease activity